jgi:hypothetical protein
MTIAIFTTSPFVVCAGPYHGKMAASRGAMLLYVVFRVELNYTGKLDLMRTRSSFYRRESSREKGRLPAMLLPCYMGESAFVCVCRNKLPLFLHSDKKGRKKNCLIVIYFCRKGLQMRFRFAKDGRVRADG